MSFLISLAFGLFYFTLLWKTDSRRVYALLGLRLLLAAGFMILMLKHYRAPLEIAGIAAGLVAAQVAALLWGRYAHKSR